MAKIEPFTLPIVGTANNLMLRVLPFDMEADNCSFYYELQNITDGQIGNNIELILAGNIEMTEAEYSAWGADNDYCIQWAANKLGLTLI